MSEQLQTHSSDCHKWHHECAVGRLESAWQAQRDAENELSKALAGQEMAEAEVRRLNAELAEARREIRSLSVFATETLKNDERYRWLREQCGPDGNLTIAEAGGWSLRPWGGDDPDAAIDAARKEAP